MAFIKAERGEIFVKAVIAGCAGSGKSYTAINLATFLAAYTEGIAKPGDNSLAMYFPEVLSGVVAVIESENRAREYAGGKPFEYSVEELVEYGPNHWSKALEEARKAGFRAVVLDSMSDEWRGRGGCLQLVEELGGKFDAWGSVKKAHWNLIEQIQNYPGHVLITVRSKTGIEIEDRGGKKVAVKTPPTPIQEEEFPFRFSHYFEMFFNETSRSPELHVVKTVANTIASGEVYDRPGRELADRLFQWCAQENSAPSQFKITRGLLKSAKTTEDLSAIGVSIKNNLSKYTLREVAILREVANARALELASGGADER